ncbi:unnamed protein product [Bursaphelenchus xylophilus]|uniref:(pine wood nematode) hypothetical protein n=1 Tax=Bursaphelenchus xylophilus TaxID=6326 RepID=A0A7I8XNT3_BURXY|nr:unnamed protein product [Bursaphelenchus xylophilus]CAG9088192.1 unnamed protein product [Bursaphelenchus xylophilus]
MSRHFVKMLVSRLPLVGKLPESAGLVFGFQRRQCCILYLFFESGQLQNHCKLGTGTFMGPRISSQVAEVFWSQPPFCRSYFLCSDSVKKAVRQQTRWGYHVGSPSLQVEHGGTEVLEVVFPARSWSFQRHFGIGRPIQKTCFPSFLVLKVGKLRL